MLFPVTVHCDAPKLNKNNEKNAVRIFSVIQNVSAVEEFSFCFSKHMIMSKWCVRERVSMIEIANAQIPTKYSCITIYDDMHRKESP